MFRVVCTLGARDFSCAVSGFGQVLESDSAEGPRRVGLQPTKLLVTREKKSLVPRVRCSEPLMKTEARVFELVSQTSVRI